MEFQQRAQEVVLRGEDRRAGHEHDHDLAGLEAALDEHMAQKAAPCHLVVRRHFEIDEQLSNVDDDAVGGFVLRHAAVHRDDVVRAALVDAGDDAPGARCAERCLHLVAVVVRIFHADDRFHMAEAPEKPDAQAVFPRELLLVAEVLKLAAAAFLTVRAAVFVLRGGHSGIPSVSGLFSASFIP